MLLLLYLCFIRRWINRYKQQLHLEEHTKYLQSLEELDIADKPNILIILCDDLGYGDIGSYGATTIKTPNIDQLAKEGVLFTQFYSSAPVCSPSRAGLLTGRYPNRCLTPTVFYPKRSIWNTIMSVLDWFQYGVKGLPQDEITLAEVLKKVGYNTALLGKWHLGCESPHLPNDKGFNFFYGAHYSNDMHPYELWLNKKVETPASSNNQNVLTKKLTEQGIQFIKHCKKSGKQLFLHYCQPFPHNPLHASEMFRGTSQAGLYGDAVQELDWSIGEIIETLKLEGLYENTIIFFTSDNGPWFEGNVNGLRGRKNLPFEGGQRVPLIVSWKNKITPGRKIDAVASNLDIFPTILQYLGIPFPEDRIIDGKNIFPLLTGKTNESPTDFFYYFWGKKLLAVRDNQYKYHTRHFCDIGSYAFIRTRPILFDLGNDPSESYDQFTHYPEKFNELNEKLENMKISMKKNLRGWKQESFI